MAWTCDKCGGVGETMDMDAYGNPVFQECNQCNGICYVNYSEKIPGATLQDEMDTLEFFNHQFKPDL